MNTSTRTALAELNRAFYAQFAGDFAATRQSWPPGFKLILPHLAPRFNVLDLGCGNARLLLFLHEEGWRGHYLGVDGSAELLVIAASNAQGLEGASAAFVHADLLDETWPGRVRAVAGESAAFDIATGVDAQPPSTPPGAATAIAALAVLHHIPGADRRAALLRDISGLLPPGGVAVISTWQFLRAPRLARLILPWREAGIDETDVEPGDYLLAWGQGRTGRRYCAFIDEAALRRLAEEAGLVPMEIFYADGLEGNLNLYAILAKR